MWGDTVLSFGAVNWSTKNIKYKKHHGLKWMPVDDFKCNNQQKTGGQDGEEFGVKVRRAGGMGEAQFHCFGGV